MHQQFTALLAINLPVLLNNQNLPYVLRNAGVRVINKTPINTKENILVEVERFKPNFCLVYTNLAGAISLNETIFKTKQVSPGTKIILIANENDSGKVCGYFQTIVDGVIWFENLSNVLEPAIKQIAKGEPFLCGKSLADLKKSLLTKQGEEKIEAALLSLLTDRELEVLHSLTKGVNYKQISKDLFISESTVKTHVNNIFTKLNVNDRTQAVLYALKHGIEGIIKKTDILDNAINQPVQK